MTNTATRREFLHRSMIGISALALTGTATAAEKKRPNILFILTDDQRWDMMSCAGQKILKTPHMDALAHGGVRFLNSFVTTSICAASRATIFTGTVERTHGYTFGKPPVPAEYVQNSYPALLKKAGYRTGFVGKYGVKMAGDAPKSLFDSFVSLSPPYLKKQKDGTIRHLTDIAGDKAIEFLESCKADQPFCLSLSFNAPHAEDSNKLQYIWPESVDSLYRDDVIPPPTLGEPEFFNALPEFQRKSMNRIRWYWRFDTPEKYQEMVKGYFRMISAADNVIGRLREKLTELGMDDNTVILLNGDNGYFLGERGFAGKWVPYEYSLRVPMVLYDPRPNEIAKGTTPKQTVLNLDIAPTLLDLAGLEKPSTMQGESFLTIAQGKDVKSREDFFFEHLMENPTIPKLEGVRTDRWKYIRFIGENPHYEELYDLQKDPLEKKNLIGEGTSQRILNRMRKRCNELRDQYGGVYVSPKKKN